MKILTQKINRYLRKLIQTSNKIIIHSHISKRDLDMIMVKTQNIMI